MNLRCTAVDTPWPECFTVNREYRVLHADDSHFFVTDNFNQRAMINKDTLRCIINWNRTVELYPLFAHFEETQ